MILSESSGVIRDPLGQSVFFGTDETQMSTDATAALTVSDIPRLKTVRLAKFGDSAPSIW